MLDPNRRNPTSGFSDRVVKGFVDGKTPLFSGNGQPVGGNVVNKFLDDPTYLGFSIFFDFQNSPLLFVSDDSTIQGDYAYKYLSEVSPTRAKLLKTFVESLQYLQYNKPYVYQGMEGLDRAWNIATDLKDSYMGGDEAKIGIECLESLDLRMTAIMDIYRKIVYDTNGRREILPANLRKFRCTVFVQEIRRFKTLTAIIRQQQSNTSSAGATSNFVSPVTASGGLFNASVLNSVANGNEQDPISLFVNDNVSTISFNFEFCEFLPEMSSTVFSSFNNKGEKTAAQQKIGFTYEKVYEVNRYSSIDSELNDKNISTADSLGLGRAESALAAASRRVLSSLAGTVKSRVGDALVAKAKELGVSNPLGTLNTITTLLSADGVARFGESLLMNAGNNLINGAVRGAGLPNVYAGSAKANQLTPLKEEKILPDVPAQNPLNPYKVFSAGSVSDALTEKLDPLSSLSMPSTAYQPTNFNGAELPKMTQEKVFSAAQTSSNFSTTNTIGKGQSSPTYKTEKIMPAGYQPTNNDGTAPPQLSAFKVLGAGGPPGPSLNAEKVF
jgi:hypothetical protein